MAYALVGSVGSVASGTTSVSPAFAQATSAGNLLVAWVAVWALSTAASVTSSDENWVQATQTASATFGVQIFYRPNSGASESAPSFLSANGTQMFAALAEFSGGATVSPVDKVTSGGPSSSTSPLVVPTTAADIEAGQLMLTSVGWLLSMAGTQTTVDTYNNGATASGNLNNDGTSTVNHYRFAYGITTGNSAADQTSQSNNSMNISLGRGAIASFKLASVVAVPRYGYTNFQDPGVF